VHQTFASLYHLLPVATTTTTRMSTTSTTTMRTTTPRRRRKLHLSPSRNRHGIRIYHSVIMSLLVARAPASPSTAPSLDQAPVSLQQLFSRKREKKGMLLQTCAIEQACTSVDIVADNLSGGWIFTTLLREKSRSLYAGSLIPLLLTSHSSR